MHLLVSLIWFGSFMVYAMTLGIGAIPQAIVSGAVSVIAAFILRGMSSTAYAQPAVKNTHYRPEAHHHIHDPVHYYHDHRQGY